ncbi:MAG TPA: Hsp20/alpha crystallin family protein [Caulobacteraceae bacterium]|nr:Hsp20/alpha crystallin family protein [Caulobacteraceae bacterium]
MADKTTALTPTNLAVPDVFSGFRRSFERFFDEVPGFGGWASMRLAPRIDVTDKDGVIEITAELPGLEEKDVNVSVQDGALIVSGEKKAESEKKEKDYVYSERSYGSFLRRVPLPAGVDAKSVKAALSKGVLTVKVTKPAEAKATKIEVKAAA